MKFCCEIMPRYHEIDKMGFLHNSAYQTIFEEAKASMTRSTGYSYAELENDGICLPITDFHCSYKSPVFYSDCIKVYVWVALLKTYSTKLFFRITKNNDKIIAAEGYAIHAAIDAITKQLCEIPEKVVSLWTKYTDDELLFFR